MDIGDRIRTARKAAGLSQEELARRANMSLKGMSYIERGRIEDPHYSSLRGIATGLGMTIGELLEEKIRRTPPPSGNRLNDQVLEEGGISEEQMRHYQVGAVITSLRKLIEYSENRLAEDDYYTLERLHELLELDNEYWYAYGFTVRPRIEEWASPAQLDELMHLDKHLIAVRRRIRQAHKVLLAQERDPGKVERFRAKQVNLQEREKQHERFLAMGTGA